MAGGAQQAIDPNCYRDLKICVEAIAALDEHSLSARTAAYDIESWDTKSIRTAPSQEPCGYVVIVVDRDPPKVYSNKVNDQTQSQICTTPGLVATMELDCVAPGSVIGRPVR